MDKNDSLPLKYRPKYLDEMMGNKATIASIESILKKEKSKIPKAWMFVGSAGCGKTTLARIVRDELGCDPLDFREYNGSNTRKIADIRKLQENIVTYPRTGDIKIYLIDEAHRLTPEAQDALLKMLEEPPPHAYIMLATTNPEKLIKPIHSRCTIIKVNPLPSKEIKELVRWTLDEELGQEESEQFPEDVIKAIARNSGGACRDALKLLDMIIDMDDFDDMIAVIEMGVPQEGDLKELCNLIKTPRTQWPEMAKFLRNFTEDPENIRRQVLNWFTTMLLNDGSSRTRLILVAFSEDNYFDSGKAGLVGTCYDIVHMK